MTQRFNADWLEKAVGLLALARQHEVTLTVNGDKLRLTRAHSVDPRIVEMLAENKADIIDVMSKPDAIKLWLDGSQATLANQYEVLNDGRDRWDAIESIYHDLFPTDSECVCTRGYCIDAAIITCDACVLKNHKEKGS